MCVCLRMYKTLFLSLSLSEKKNGSDDNRGLVVIYGSPFGSLHKKKRISQYSDTAAAAAAVAAD